MTSDDLARIDWWITTWRLLLEHRVNAEPRIVTHIQRAYHRWYEAVEQHRREATERHDREWRLAVLAARERAAYKGTAACVDRVPMIHGRTYSVAESGARVILFADIKQDRWLFSVRLSQALNGPRHYTQRECDRQRRKAHARKCRESRARLKGRST